MSTNATPTETHEPTKATKTKATKGSRSYSITLTSADGSTLKITAQRRKDGSAVTFAVHTTKDGKKRTNDRGASSEHPDLDKAKGAAERLGVEAIKRGWVRKERAAGFERKPDAFTAANLPSATTKPSKK